MPNVLAERIEETLRPIVGTVLASVSVDLESRRIGKTPDTITRLDLEAIADNLTSQLRLVVGNDLAAAAAQKVRELA
jgi:ubiquinone biosynthesis protein UbiJ